MRRCRGKASTFRDLRRSVEGDGGAEGRGARPDVGDHARVGLFGRPDRRFGTRDRQFRPPVDRLRRGTGRPRNDDRQSPAAGGHQHVVCAKPPRTPPLAAVPFPSRVSRRGGRTSSQHGRTKPTPLRGRAARRRPPPGAAAGRARAPPHRRRPDPPRHHRRRRADHGDRPTRQAQRGRRGVALPEPRHHPPLRRRLRTKAYTRKPSVSR